MNYTDTITENFNNGFFDKVMSIRDLPAEYPAWTINRRTQYGVIIPTDNDEKFRESFSSVEIFTEQNVNISGKVYNVIMLISENIELKSEFATICSQFVDPGDNGENRKKLIADPQQWWDRWKTLLGNALSQNEPYPVLGELTVLSYYITKGEAPLWRGPDSASNDIEFSDFSCEVKSTTQRYAKEITVSGIHQLKSAGKELELVFCRFERSLSGKSINDVVDELVQSGYDKTDLENNLDKLGLSDGCVARKLKYKLLEMNKYQVDDSFPVITEKSFKNDILPANIIKFTYTVDLAGLDCENLL